MNGSLMNRAAYAYALLALVVVIVGCSTSSKTNTQANHSANLGNRVPSQDSEVAGDPIVDAGTVNINSVLPNLTKKTVTLYAKACGHLYQGESSHTALNNEDAHYFLKINCSLVKNASLQNAWARFIPGAFYKKGHKGTLTDWKRDAVKKSNTRDSRPYLCFQGQVTAALCSNAPSAITAVDFLTQVPKTYASWKE